TSHLLSQLWGTLSRKRTMERIWLCIQIEHYFAGTAIGAHFFQVSTQSCSCSCKGDYCDWSVCLWGHYDFAVRNWSGEYQPIHYCWMGVGPIRFGVFTHRSDWPLYPRGPWANGEEPFRAVWLAIKGASTLGTRIRLCGRQVIPTKMI